MNKERIADKDPFEQVQNDLDFVSLPIRGSGRITVKLFERIGQAWQSIPTLNKIEPEIIGSAIATLLGMGTYMGASFVGIMVAESNGTGAVIAGTIAVTSFVLKHHMDPYGTYF